MVYSQKLEQALKEKASSLEEVLQKSEQYANQVPGVLLKKLDYTIEQGGLVKSGTTILGIKYNDGIVVAADRKTSLGDLCTYDLEAKKIKQIGKDITISGCGLVFAIRLFEWYLNEFRMDYENTFDEKFTVDEAASVLELATQSQLGLYAGFQLAGCDKEGKPKLYTVDFGTKNLMERCCDGSGAILGGGSALLDRYPKNLTKDQAIEAAIETLIVTTRRDHFSNAKNDAYQVIAIEKDGIHELDETTVRQIAQKIKKRAGELV
jgi:20S proteasome alpha/beta subunit